MIKICLVCEVEFKTHEKKRKYCGRTCYYEMKRLRKDKVIWTESMRKNMSEKMTGAGNHRYGIASPLKGKTRPEFTGELHPKWKCGKWTDIYGYTVVQNKRDTNGKKILEHRFVLEKHLGRKLASNEIVHHINENKHDNRIENLQIMTRAEHVRIHRRNNEYYHSFK